MKKKDKLEPTLRYIIPKKNLLVRMPFTKTPIPEVGMIVPWTGAEGRFWRRRFKDNSIEVLTHKPSVETPKAETTEIKTEKKTGGSK